MIDVTRYIKKLTVLNRWMKKDIDGLSEETLEKRLYDYDVRCDISEINAVSKKKERVVAVTEHAYERGKERLSLSKGSLDKLAEKAFLEGIAYSDVTGSLRRYIDKKRWSVKGDRLLKIYGEVLYIFSKRNSVLITVYQIPLEFRRAAIKEQKR